MKRLALLVCTCEGHAKTAECSHQLAIGHLMQFFSCDDTVTSLEGTLRKLGRPTSYVPVGYAANKETQQKRQTDPMQYVGKMVAMRFPNFAPKNDQQRFWIGRVEGKPTIAFLTASQSLCLLNELPYLLS